MFKAVALRDIKTSTNLTQILILGYTSLSTIAYTFLLVLPFLLVTLSAIYLHYIYFS